MIHAMIPIAKLFDPVLFRKLMKLSVPLLFAGIGQLLYSLIDTYWVSRIDPTNSVFVASTGLVFPFFMLSYALSGGIITGLASLVSRARGENNQSALDQAAESGLVIALTLTVLITGAVIIFERLILQSQGAQGELLEQALSFLNALLPAVPFVFASAVLTGIFQGEANSKPVMIATIVGAVANVILDPLFIFTFHGGLAGAGYATAVSQFLAFLILLAFYLRSKNRMKIHWSFRNASRNVLKQISVVGFPSAVNQLFFTLYFFFYNQIVLSVSQDALTALTLYSRVETLALIPLFSISSGLLTLAGQTASSGQTLDTKRIWRTAWFTGQMVILPLFLVVICASPWIVEFFTDSRSVLQFALQVIPIFAFSLNFSVVEILAPSYFQGLGYVKPAIAMTVLRLFAFILPLSYLYVYAFQAGFAGMAWGVLSGNAIAAIVNLVWVENHLRKLVAGKVQARTTKTSE